MPWAWADRVSIVWISPQKMWSYTSHSPLCMKRKRCLFHYRINFTFTFYSYICKSIKFSALGLYLQHINLSFWVLQNCLKISSMWMYSSGINSSLLYLTSCSNSLVLYVCKRKEVLASMELLLCTMLQGAGVGDLGLNEGNEWNELEH
jgi:hypothetical protein